MKARATTIPAGTGLRLPIIIPTGGRELVEPVPAGGMKAQQEPFSAAAFGRSLLPLRAAEPARLFLHCRKFFLLFIICCGVAASGRDGSCSPKRGPYLFCSRHVAAVPVSIGGYDMRVLPVAAGCLFLLAGCLPPQPGPATYVEYHPAPVRHEVRPAPRPAPPAPVPRPQVHKPAPAPRPEAHKPVIHKPAPAPRPEKQVAPARPGNRPQPAPSMQRPSSPPKGQPDRHPASGKNEPGGPGPRR